MLPLKTSGAVDCGLEPYSHVVFLPLVSDPCPLWVVGHDINVVLVYGLTIWHFVTSEIYGTDLLV